MIQCQNCGQANSQESQFCRFCGTRFLQPQIPVQQTYEVQPPRAYSWKTDEFQTKTDARRTSTLDNQNTRDHLQFPPYQPASSSAIANRGVQFMDPNYRCPHCRSQFLPKTERRISTAGWITFAVLLVTIFPLFWIGLLIKEDVYVCPSCNTRLGK